MNWVIMENPKIELKIFLLSEKNLNKITYDDILIYLYRMELK